ncbi:MAG: PrsW family intramembrane metalloprotease [Patescibacteria group bacterium]|nr:PrsW family intramembrane metalloprotease [Patescibacteria group bacterium]
MEEEKQEIKEYVPHRPGVREKLFFFVSGAIISVPFAILTNALTSDLLVLSVSGSLASFLAIAFFAPFLEEFAKAYPLFFRHGETERSIIILGFLTGFGFGLVEFFIYVFGFGAPILIRIPMVLFHATNTTIVAYGLGKNKAFLFYLLVVFLHAINNTGAFLGALGIILIAAAILTSYFLAYTFYKNSTERTLDFWVDNENKRN